MGLKSAQKGVSVLPYKIPQRGIVITKVVREICTHSSNDHHLTNNNKI